MTSADFLLVLTRDDDSSIDALRQQAGHRVLHARVADLGHAGWRYVGGRPDQATAFASDRVVFAPQCAAVVCRIAAVVSTDLPWLHDEDRVYAAAENTAFLRAWLAQFAGIRCNEPTWMSLAGPGWHPLQWTWLVGGLGIPATSFDRDAGAIAVVAGDEVFGVDDPILIGYSRRIARAVQSRLLSVRFADEGGWKFVAADPCPALEDSSAAALLDALLAKIRSGRRTHPSLVAENARCAK